MTTVYSRARPAPHAIDHDLERTARTTGALYLAFFVLGILGTFVVRGRLLVDGDPGGTLANLTAHPTLARADIALELGIVLVQALTALSFYRLFVGVDRRDAGALLAFGTVNAAAVLGSAAVLATALGVAQEASLAAAGGAAATVQLLYVLSGHLWGVAALFFGLWLLPMGRLVIRSRWLPRLLGRLLVVAGIGYVLNAFVTYLFPDAGVVAQLLTVPSIVGELWIAGHLLLAGIREHPDAEGR